MSNEQNGIEERREKILDLIAKEGKVKIPDLCTLFEISEVTARTDLDGLEKEGLLERIRGGAVGTYKSYLALPFSGRMDVNKNEKERIAKTCAHNVFEGNSLFFTAGSTSLFAAREIFSTKGISIVTNSIILAGEARMNKVERVILLGGMLDADYQFTYGDDTINHIRKYMADKLIMSVDGISAEGGVTTHHFNEVEATRIMMERSSYIIVLADSTKIGRTGFASICPASSVDLLITDMKASLRQIRDLEAMGVRVAVV